MSGSAPNEESNKSAENQSSSSEAPVSAETSTESGEAKASPASDSAVNSRESVQLAVATEAPAQSGEANVSISAPAENQPSSETSADEKRAPASAENIEESANPNYPPLPDNGFFVTTEETVAETEPPKSPRLDNDQKNSLNPVELSPDLTQVTTMTSASSTSEQSSASSAETVNRSEESKSTEAPAIPAQALDSENEAGDEGSSPQTFVRKREKKPLFNSQDERQYEKKYNKKLDKTGRINELSDKAGKSMSEEEVGTTDSLPVVSDGEAMTETPNTSEEMRNLGNEAGPVPTDASVSSSIARATEAGAPNAILFQGVFSKCAAGNSQPLNPICQVFDHLHLYLVSWREFF